MKKIFAIILILALLVSFGSCSTPSKKETKSVEPEIKLKSAETKEEVVTTPESSEETEVEAIPTMDPTGEEESAYVTYVDVETTDGATISIAAMRGEEVIKEPNHAIYKNSNIEMEINIVEGTTATAVIGEEGTEGTEELASYRSGDTYYVAKKISPEGTFVLYRLETKPNFDVDILETVLTTINYEE